MGASLTRNGQRPACWHGLETRAGLLVVLMKPACSYCVSQLTLLSLQTVMFYAQSGYTNVVYLCSVVTARGERVSSFNAKGCD